MGRTLWEVSQYLGIKTGMGAEFYFSWRLENRNGDEKWAERVLGDWDRFEDLKITDLRRTFYFTDENQAD